jgi:membrane-bound inhibitor of C-type lysozyme
VVAGEAVSKSFFSYAGAIVATYFQQYWLAAAFLSSGVAAEKERSARNKARDEFNASLRDRLQMVDLQPDAPRTLALGRVRAVEGVRRRWTSGTNSETLTLIVSFAGHEIDGFESFWFNDQQLTLDNDGWVQTAPYQKTANNTLGGSVQLSGAGGASIVLQGVPITGTLTATWYDGTGTSRTEGALGIAGSGVNYTLSGGPASVWAQYSYQVSTGTSLARIRTWLGTDAQNVGAALASEYPGQIDASDKFSGIALAVVDLTFDPDVYPQGIPNITATFRGAKCLDPRNSTTAWTENPALHAYHYARWAYGWAVPVGEIRIADIVAAADFCDMSTDFDVGGTTVTLPRYRCGIVISSAAEPRASMDEIMETMAGRWGWAGGTWRMRCGRMATPVWALDESWIAARVGASGEVDQGPVVRIANGVPRENKVNRIAGKCVDPDQRWQVLPYPAVEDSTLISAEGAEYAVAIDYQGVNAIAHAQHLAKVAIRQSQAALRMEITSNLSAYKLELFDVGTVSIARYGMVAKTMEVIGWRWRPTEGVLLRLAEITDDIFVPIGTLTGRDPAPNSNLLPPWSVPQIVGVTVASGTAELTDGSIITRTRVSWTPPATQSVLVGGHIEVQYTEATDTLPADDWPSWEEQGSAESALIPGLITDRYYLFRVRAVNSFGVRGPWSEQVRHLVATPPPSGAQPLLLLRSTAMLFSYDGSGAASPAAQTITLVAELTNLAGTATFLCTLYDATGASLGPVTLGGTGNTRTLTVSQFAAAAYAVVSATLSGLTGTLTIARVQSGAGGAYSATVFLFARTPTNSTPTRPQANLTYAFATGALTGALGVWSSTVPSGGGAYLWMTQALVYNTTTTDTVEPGDWSAARLIATDGTSGASIKVQSNGGAVFSATGGGTTWTPSSMVLSRVLQGGLTTNGTTTWTTTQGTFTGSLSVINNITGAFASFGPSAMTTDTVTFRCTHLESSVSYTDDITIFKSRDGSSAYLDNDSIVLPATSGGTITSYTGANGTMIVVAGGAQVLTGVGVLSFTIVGFTGFTGSYSSPGNSQLSGNITINATSGSYQVFGAVDPASAIATVTFQATYANPLGGSIQYRRTFTIGKSSAGAAGTSGTSAARAYALYTCSPSAPTVTGSPVVTAGTSLPSSGSWSPASATAWSSNTQTPGSSQAMFQSDGLYNPVTNQTTWGVPYLSNFKVGSLEAITANMGTLTAGTISGTANITIAGSARFDGMNSLLTVPTLGGIVTATAVNTGGSAANGIWGNSTSFGPAYGVIGTAAVGNTGYAGVLGYGNIGVSGRSGAPSGEAIGVQGSGANTSTSRGVQGLSGAVAGSIGVHALAIGSGTALYAQGPSTFTAALTLTGQSVATGTGIANFPGTNKPGGTSTCQWMSISVNGAACYIPVWT